MRYENWDVLLFPETSKVPLQEFKTQCFVTKDKESPYLHSPALISPASCSGPQGNLGQLPVLTTFIPSLRHNTPFRVSIHSWERPMPSRFMEGLLQPDDTLLFEVRVFIDGLCVSGSVFTQRSSWPHVLDLSSYVDKSGNQDRLRFPTFHHEILKQPHWDAGELYGRIRVVLAEGFSRPHRSPPFERVKEVVAFAFQHAPIQILEYSEIAWPNASMWTREPRLFKYNSGGATSNMKEPEDSHAHSPSRHDVRQILATKSQTSNQSGCSSWSYRNYQPQVTQWQGQPGEPRWLPQEQLITDPFIDPCVLDPAARHRGARASWEDVPMPDYTSNSSSSRAISSMTGISYEHSKHPSIVTPIDEESYTQLIEALSPAPLNCGTYAPTNTPSTALPMGAKLSAAVRARSESYSKSAGRETECKETSVSETRDISASSTKTNPVVDATATGKVHASPSTHVKSRKEILSYENKENDVSVEISHKDSDKSRQTPVRPAVRTSEIMGTPTESQESLVLCSADAAESIHRPKREPILLFLTQDSPMARSLVQQANLDGSPEARPPLASAALEVAELD
ncbi:uncharacterized protein BP01DRAFT_138889 [Aspergillus saccharolyticus JOP 1030-1]|uniref:Uncharacterized protein n=1 Tax=Aspergillus saccharolyticus JOP 1030-1 TaxID=1450539 RepID=A0A318Z523_9EURO|nr:hypothetical protein BP01DRAFT_138889 [Aspergillus saccharolyticus JOP 1030-1]PYH42196.1 hypothetical protein BP01DRAFT_138889 [Aspergillus saccharolyticus JOP 1030-1]